MTLEQAISNLKEIIELSRDEINKKDKNLTAILDLTDLESLDVVLSKLEEKDKIIDLMAEMLVKVPNNSDSPQTATIIAMMNRDLELRKIKVKQYFENKVKEEK